MRLKFVEVLKFIVALCIGITLKTLYDVWDPNSLSNCAHCVNIHCKKAFDVEDVVKPHLHVQLREQFQPSSIDTVIPYQYYTGKYLYDTRFIDDDVYKTLGGYEQADIEAIVQDAMALLSSSRHNRQELSRLVNGYKRFDALRGEEYILDIETSSKHDVEIPKPIYRLHLVKPFGTVQLLDEIKHTSKPMLNILLPVFAANFSVRLPHFLEKFEETCLATNELISLIVVLFSEVGTKGKFEGDEVRKYFLSLKPKYKNAKIRVIETKKPFSRTLGLDLAAGQLPWTSLMFFADIDIEMSQAFLDRCRTNPKIGAAVYYPIPFSLYNSSVVLNHTPKGFINSFTDLNKVSKNTGRWATESYSLVCLYKTDYNKAEFDTKQKAWGGEDRTLYKKHVTNHNLKVIRGPEPGLVHLNYQKRCDIPTMTTEQQLLCNTTRLRSLGSQEQLARKFMDAEGEP